MCRNHGRGDLPLDVRHRGTGRSITRRILVVEDEGFLRHAVAKMLPMNGFDVFEAADESFAIDLLRANGSKIDAILLDVTIPGASSREILAEASKTRPAIRVVLTSAYGQAMFSAATNGPQISSFIRKPFQLADLAKRFGVPSSLRLRPLWMYGEHP